MVLTEEQKTDAYPAATLETATINNESIYYGNLTNTQVNKPSWFSDPLYANNAKVARLRNRAGIQKIGPNIILKVMAGDTYNIRVASGWKGGAASNNSTNVMNDLLSLLSGGVAGLTAAYRLQQRGVEVHLYEASQRLGGRMWTKRNFPLKRPAFMSRGWLAPKP